MLVYSLFALGKKIRFVKWDEKISSLVYLNRADLEYLRKRAAPSLSPEEDVMYSNTTMAGREVLFHSEQDNWLIVPGIPYLANHTGPQTIHIITTARLLGLKTAFIFYATTPALGHEMADTVFKHNEYMRQLRAADVVLPTSAAANRCLIDFFKQEGFNPEDENFHNWPEINPLPAESFIAPYVENYNPDTKFESVTLSVGSTKAVGSNLETWQHYSKRFLDALARRNDKDSVHSSTLVSIIIPVYNNVELTSQCIESILSQDIIADYEIIVVDDASTDNTQAYLKSLGNRVRVVFNPKNLRFAGACNAGARIAHGNYLLFLNNDTIPEKGWLDAMLARIIGDQHIGVVGAKLIYPDRTIQHCGIVFRPNISGFLPAHRLRNIHENDLQVNCPMQFSAVTGACLIVRSEIFNRLSGFNTSFGMYFEDIDFCLNIQQIGYIIVYEPLASVVHFERKSCSNEIEKMMRYSFILFNYKWKESIRSLGSLQYGVPYPRVSKNI